MTTIWRFGGTAVPPSGGTEFASFVGFETTSVADEDDLLSLLFPTFRSKHAFSSTRYGYRHILCVVAIPTRDWKFRGQRTMQFASRPTTAAKLVRAFRGNPRDVGQGFGRGRYGYVRLQSRAAIGLSSSSTLRRVHRARTASQRRQTQACASPRIWTGNSASLDPLPG